MCSSVKGGPINQKQRGEVGTRSGEAGVDLLSVGRRVFPVNRWKRNVSNVLGMIGVVFCVTKQEHEIGYP